MSDRLEISALTAPTKRGSSQPWRGLASDGNHYLFKFRGAGHGSYALLAELVVNRLAVHWNLPVPVATPAWLPESFPRVGTDEFWDVMDASAGWNLAITWIDDATDVSLTDAALPTETRAGMTALDLLFANYDRSAANGNVLRQAGERLWLIDHGSCLFGRRLQAPPRFELPPNHVYAGADYAPLLAGCQLSACQAGPLVEDLPDEWLADLGIERTAFVSALDARVEEFRRTILPAP